MPEKVFNPDGDFTVKEARTVNFVVAAIFTGITIYGLITDGPRTMLWVAIFPAIFNTAKAVMNRTVITINQKGIYHNTAFITNWNNFLNASITEENPNRNIDDRFVLLIEYRKDGIEGYFKRKIPLTNTQNKSEEEIIEAITFFRNHSANP